MIWLVVCYGISADIPGGCVSTKYVQYRSVAACEREAIKIDPDGFGKNSAYCTDKVRRTKRDRQAT